MYTEAQMAREEEIVRVAEMAREEEISQQAEMASESRAVRLTNKYQL